MGVISNAWQNADVKAKVVIVVPIVIVLVIAIWSVIRLIPEAQMDKRVTVTNYSDENVSVPRGYQQYISERIGDILRKNTMLSETEIADGAIREGTYNESTDNNIMTASFIVDVESVKQSFDVKVIWPKGKDIGDDPNVTITCPYYTDVIYTDTKCQVTTPENQLKRYLPHYDYIDDIKYAVNYQRYTDQMYLRIEISACGDANLQKSAINETKNWLKSRYLDPNDYKIETVDTCRR